MSSRPKYTEAEAAFLEAVCLFSKCRAHFARAFYKSLGYEVLLNYTQLDPTRQIVPPQNDADMELFPENDQLNREKLRLVGVLLPPSQIAELFPDQSAPEQLFYRVENEMKNLIKKVFMLKKTYEGYRDKCLSLIVAKSDLIAKMDGEETNYFFLNGFKARIASLVKSDEELQNANIVRQSLRQFSIMVLFTLCDWQKIVEKIQEDAEEGV